MKTVIAILSERIGSVMEEVTGRSDCQPIVKPATDDKFGDYQANGVMALAKKLGQNPRELAEKITAKLQLADICEPPGVTGPGFINIRLKPDFVAERLLEVQADSGNRLGIDKAAQAENIVVDFSGPNIAKQMHVGHLRSTIIGDSICRMLEFLGHKVIRQNHIGDWGTNFGMVILGLWHICMSEKRIDKKPYYQTELEELKNFTKDGRRLKDIRDRHEEDWREDSDEELGDGKKFFNFLEKLKNSNEDDIWPKILLAYQYVNLLEETVTDMGLMIPTRMKQKLHREDTKHFDYVSIPYKFLSRHITAYYLQNIDDPDNEQEKEAWELITKISLEHCDTIYDILNVKITDKHFDYQVVRGESFYKDMLSDVVADLQKQGLAVESEGAICVFPKGFKNKEGKRLPFIIQKSDGAYLYATTDLAAIRYRVNELKADRIVYVTDARQNLHFAMLFAVAKMANWVSDDKLAHVTFGSVLGEDGRPFKTRSGENVKLKELLDEAVVRAKAVVEEKNPDLSAERKDEIAAAVGIGALKYADFSNNRESDYIFSFDKMLSLEGNTAPYMQYAYARIKSIERKAQSRDVDIETELAGIKKLVLTAPAELDLAKCLIRYGQAVQAAVSDYRPNYLTAYLRYGQAVQAAVSDYRPNYLTAYLYELAQKFSAFYTNCPVLDSEAETRASRLVLCDLTAKTIKHGLSQLLGIKVVEQM